MSSGLFGIFAEILGKWRYLIINNDFLFGLERVELKRPMAAAGLGDGYFAPLGLVEASAISERLWRGGG